MENNQEFIWAQRYRPNTVEDCVLPELTKKQVKEFITKGEIPHFLFHGVGGVGKTTLAKAIASELDCDLMVINASNETGIDNIRVKVAQFASTVSFGSDKFKIILLDEADYLSHHAQALLRGFFEEFSKNCRFILTCNFKGKILEALYSRCTAVNFNVPASEKKELAKEFYGRCITILQENSVAFDAKTVSAIVKKNFPDFRKTLNILQQSSSTGTLLLSNVEAVEEEEYAKLYGYLKDKNFGEVRKWVVANKSYGCNQIFRKLYDGSNEHFELSSVPELIINISDYSHKLVTSVDEEITMAAFFLEIMISCKLK